MLALFDLPLTEKTETELSNGLRQSVSRGQDCLLLHVARPLHHGALHPRPRRILGLGEWVRREILVTFWVRKTRHVMKAKV